MKDNNKPFINYSFIYLVSCLISFSSLYIFITNGHNTFDWPAVDIIPTIKRYFNADYLKNDFVTNANEIKNPRHFFIYLIIYLSKIFNNNWYLIFFSIKCFLVFFLPISYFSIIYSFLWKRLKNKLSFYSTIVLIFLFLVLSVKNPFYLTIGWWPSIMIQPTPQSTSLFLCFIYFSLKNFGYTKKFNYLILIFSCLIHLPIAFLASIFNLVCTSINSKLKDHTITFSIILIIGFILVNYYESNSNLSSKEFIKYYILESHPFHYSIEHLGSAYHPWTYNFVFYNLVFVAGIIFGFYKDEFIFLKSVRIFLCFFSLLFINHFFTRFITVKSVASVGLTRFYMFSSVLSFIVFLLIFTHYLNKISFYKKKRLKKIKLPYFNLKIAVFTLVIILSFSLNRYYKNPNPFELNNNSYILKWIVNNTKSDDIIASFDKNLEISINAERSTFISPVFTFNEDYIKEYCERKKLLFGTHKDYEHLEFNFSYHEQGPRVFYHLIQPLDFIEISKKYKLDLLILENKLISSSYDKIKRAYSDDKYSIFRLKDLKQYYKI